MLDRQIFSERLKELREKNNMSCASLALRIGVTGASLGYYERGERVPDIETTQKLCVVFGVTSDYLLGLSDTPSPDIEDQAICKKLGIEGETLEALKYIFLGVPWDNIPDDMIVPSFIEDLMNITLVDIQNTREAFSMFIEGAAEEKETNKYHSFLRTLCKYNEVLAKIAKIDEEDEDTRERYEEELYAAEWRVQKGVTSILNIIAERITMPDEWRERKEGR